MNIARMVKPGPVTMKLYNKLVAIQYGDEPDDFGWITLWNKLVIHEVMFVMRSAMTVIKIG